MTRIGSKWALSFCLAAMLAFLPLCLGCGEPVDNMPQKVEKKTPPSPRGKAKPVSKSAEAEAASEEEAEPSMTQEEMAKVLKKKTEEKKYDPINKTDPFKRFVVDRGGPDVITGPTKYELRFYSLRGIAWGPIDPIAMFEDPNGDAFAIHEGDLLGREEGKVVDIQPELVEVAIESIGWDELKNYKKVEIQLYPESE